MNVNVVMIFVAALVPMIVGFIWYHPKVMGTMWMDASGMTEEKARESNMLKTFGISYLMAVLLAFGVNFMVIHQFHLYSMFFHELQADNQVVQDLIAEVMKLGGNNHRTFGHGALHGFIGGVVLALPVLTTNALFEQKSGKYIAVNSIYWIITMMLMGGLLCQFG